MSEPKEPLWMTYEQAIAIHSRQLASLRRSTRLA